MRKIEPETESAATKRAATTIVLRGANRPKLAKVRDEYPLSEAVAAAQDAGRKYVTIASRVLAGK